MPWQWTLPPSASTFAGDIDWIYYLILAITGIAFVIVEGGLIWFIIQYRGRPGRKAYYTHGNTTAEVIWTAIPAVTVVIIGVLSGRVWDHVRGRDSVPAGALEFAVEGKQFEWNVTHAGADGSLGTGDDVSVRNQLHIPVGRPVVINLTATDVIHSFFIPAFRVKQDAVPGLHQRVWFEATAPGVYDIACAELCGLGHYRMGAKVTVHTQDDYARWLAAQAASDIATR